MEMILTSYQNIALHFKIQPFMSKTTTFHVKINLDMVYFNPTSTINLGELDILVLF